jgi:hypothetical protein
LAGKILQAIEVGSKDNAGKLTFTEPGMHDGEALHLKRP